MHPFSEITELNFPIKVALRIKPSPNSTPLQWMEITSETKGILLKKQAKSFRFKFDEIFYVHSNQKEIYEKTIKPLVNGLFSGYNATVLAYGQTGTGKTYTMGTSKQAMSEEVTVGLLPRAMQDLWKQAACISKEKRCLFKVTFLEIYNEEIVDLLQQTTHKKNNVKKNSKILIREEKNGNLNLYGLNQKEVYSYEEMIELLHQGCSSRATSSTFMNQASSRSHAIFTIYLEQYPQSSNTNSSDSSIDKSAKFHLVDLAGSERMKKTGAKGNTLREGIHINRGLLALGNVITSLAKAQTHNRKKIVCFRDSKLTRILQDSMGGNSKTYMIACISGEEENFEESMSTLYYASKTRLIKNRAIVNGDPNLAVVLKLNQEIFNLKRDIIKYKRFIISDHDMRRKWDNKYSGEDDFEEENDFNEDNCEGFTTCDTEKEICTSENLDEAREIYDELLNEKGKENIEGKFRNILIQNNEIKMKLLKLENENKEKIKIIEKFEIRQWEKRDLYERILNKIESFFQAVS